MTDVALRHTNDGGEIVAANGLLDMDDGLYGAVYLSMYGGNVEDSGSDGDKANQWWGNMSELEPEQTYRSETQHALRSLPLVPASLRQIEDAVKRDLEWMVPKPASAVDVRATMPALNTIKIEVAITIDGRVFRFEFTEYGTKPAAVWTPPNPNEMWFGETAPACKGWWDCALSTITDDGGGNAESISDLSLDGDGELRGADLVLGVKIPLGGPLGGVDIMADPAGSSTYLEAINADTIAIAEDDYTAFGIWWGTGSPIFWYGAADVYYPLVISGGNLYSQRYVGAVYSLKLIGSASLITTPCTWCVFVIGDTQYTFINGAFVGSITHDANGPGSWTTLCSNGKFSSANNWAGAAVLKGTPNKSTALEMYQYVRRAFQNIANGYPESGLQV